MRKQVLSPALVIAALLLPGALSADTVVEEIVARVNSQIITHSAYQHEQKFYDQHKSEMEHPEAVKLSELLISTEQAGDDPQKLAAAEAKANDLLKQIRAGASFEDIAKKESQGLSAAQGGDLGYFERGK